MYTVAYGIGRDLHTFAGVVELCFFCMNFPSATIRAAEFPLVYPEVNNLWRDKSICARELDSQTVEEGWLGFLPPHPYSNHPQPLASSLAAWWPCTIPLWTACLKCKSVFQLVPGACQHVFLLSAAIECGPMSPLYHCNRIVDRPVTLPNRIMETYWFFFLFSCIFLLAGSLWDFWITG